MPLYSQILAAFAAILAEYPGKGRKIEVLRANRVEGSKPM
jgi:hypothetical protein